MSVNALSSPASSASPQNSPAPLTPNSVHNVSFSLPSLDNDNNTINNNNNNSNGNVGPARRKPSRRANTAERRATHNAVERQRRETLNGRFLDLAALLPNLASVRRPSKSAIVNSSIALIHTQRRARSTAAKELRLLKQETDQLRAELNEWRDRAQMGLARIVEPIRSKDFEELVSGGLEEPEDAHLEEERRALEIVKEGLRLDGAGGMDDDLTYPANYGYNTHQQQALYGLEDDLVEEPLIDVHTSSNHVSRPSSAGNTMSIPSLPIAIPRQQQSAYHHQQQPLIFDPSAGLLQSHTTHNAGIIPGYTSYAELGGQPTSTNASSFVLSSATSKTSYQPIYYNQQPTSYTSTPNSANYLSGFGLRDEDSISEHSHSSSSDIVHQNITPVDSAADPFSAVYQSFPHVSAGGGGNTYGAAMGLFI